MKIYLDNCRGNRPFDDQSQPRIREETDAIFENNHSNDDERRHHSRQRRFAFEIGKIKAPSKRAEVFSSFDRFVKEKISLEQWDVIAPLFVNMRNRKWEKRELVNAESSNTESRSRAKEQD